jgi:hypothetical protein
MVIIGKKILACNAVRHDFIVSIMSILQEGKEKRVCTKVTAVKD